MRRPASIPHVVWAGTALAALWLAASCSVLRPQAAPRPEAAVPAVEAEEATQPVLPPLPSPVVEPRAHVVVRGESLTSIARKYGTTVAELVRENGLPDPDRLAVGQRLTLPDGPEPLPVPTRGPDPALVGDMVWPVAEGRILSPFGVPRGGHTHSGVDIAGLAGQPIRAAEDGVVVFAGTLRGYGSTVILEHAEGLRSLYAHNRENTVAVGDSVRRGESIALLGRTGNATTDHCHFEIRRGEVPLDPLALVTQAEAAAAGARP